MIYDAYTKWLTYQEKLRDLEYKSRKSYIEDANGNPTVKGSLWPTDVGKCHRAAIQRVQGKSQLYTLSSKAMDYIHWGLTTENETSLALKHVYGARLTEQVILKYEMWSGKVDFGIDIGSPKPILIENKSTSEKNFDYEGNTTLPKKEHIGQAVTYMWLYEHLYNITPTVILYYKAWGNYAEFELCKVDNKVEVDSNINGIKDYYAVDYDVYGEIEQLMMWYNSPELPPRLEKKYQGCEFMGKPSCPFYRHCWGDENDERTIQT